MRLDISRDWCLRMAAIEGKIDGTIGAGTLAIDPYFEAASNIEEDPHYAFSKLINLMRRNKRLTVEDLAKSADVEVKELYEIEKNPNHKPDLRTVHLLATYFKMPMANLMQIAGLTKPSNDIIEESVRFAARSETSVELSKEERSALNQFVSYLSTKK